MTLALSIISLILSIGCIGTIIARIIVEHSAKKDRHENSGTVSINEGERKIVSASEELITDIKDRYYRVQKLIFEADLKGEDYHDLQIEADTLESILKTNNIKY